MRIGAIILSFSGLCLTVVPSFLVFYSIMPWKIHTQLMFVGMILWFIFTPLWIKEIKAKS